MFEIELCWDNEDTPEGFAWSDVSYIDVPALPPEGTVIRLERKNDDWPYRKAVPFEVEVVGAPVLDNVNGKWEYTVFVALVD